LFEFQTEDREDALCTSPPARQFVRRGHKALPGLENAEDKRGLSPHNASASVYIICPTAAVPAIIKTDEEKYYFEVGVKNFL
jgi:hypothetical protein